MGLFNATKGKHPCQLFAFRYLFSSQNTDEETSVESPAIILGQDALPEPVTINDDTTAEHVTSENIKAPFTINDEEAPTEPVAIKIDDAPAEPVVIRNVNGHTEPAAKEAPIEVNRHTEDVNDDDTAEGYSVTFVENFAATMIQKVVRGSQARTGLPAVCICICARIAVVYTWCESLRGETLYTI